MWIRGIQLVADETIQFYPYVQVMTNSPQTDLGMKMTGTSLMSQSQIQPSEYDFIKTGQGPVVQSIISSLISIVEDLLSL